MHTFRLIERINKRRYKGLRGKEEASWEDEDREKLEESESVCECNSLPLSNPREFADCRGREGGRWGRGAITAKIERYKGRERQGEKDDFSPFLSSCRIHSGRMWRVTLNKIQRHD